MMHPRFLTDRFRLIRSLLVGFVTTLALIHFVTLKETFTISITMALMWDLLTLYRKTWTLSLQETRQVFQRWQSVESYVALRSVALVFMSVGLLCFCKVLYKVLRSFQCSFLDHIICFARFS